jgi:energy-coupling factor transport system permease protein
MHQGAWIAWASAAGAVAITTTNPFYLVPLVAIAWLVHAAHAVEGPASRSFKVFMLFGLFAIATRTALVFLTPLVPQAAPISSGAIVAGVLEGARLATLLAIFGTYNSVSDPFAVLKLAPRRFHEPALAAALALSIAPRTIGAVARVREAQRLRGLDVGKWRGLPALAVPVLETGMEEALTLAESMDARGHGRGRRTRYRPESWTATSVAVALGAGVPAAAFLASAMQGAGFLTVSTFPLAWPDVSPLLLALLVVLTGPVLARRRPA